VIRPRRGDERGRQGDALLADDDLRRSVSDELSSDPKVTVDADIRVSVTDGEVTLRGTVVSYGDKREAMKVAQRLPGVRLVRDEIQVVGRTDADLRRDVLDELEIGHIPVTFNVELDEGTVTLTGSVDRQHDRDAAAFIAKVVPGVVGVENQLEVRGRSPDGEDVEDLTPADVSEIGELDTGEWPPAKTRHVGTSGFDSQRPRAGSRSFGQPRRPEGTRCGSGWNGISRRLSRMRSMSTAGWPRSQTSGRLRGGARSGRSSPWRPASPLRRRSSTKQERQNGTITEEWSMQRSER
jgi:osmotically-inducible protein OsmY